MSQAKVDRYKQEKANRKENLKKEKQAAVIRRIIAGVVAIAIIGWCGYSGYNIYESKQPVKEASINYDAMTDIDTALAEVAE